MIIGIFGDSCAGKSTIANELAKKISAEIYTGKDYMRLAKNEETARQLFIELLRSNDRTAHVIYVISEKEQLSLLPDKCVRVLVTAGLDTIKERFAKRLNGHLPAPVSAMLEKKHGSFNSEKHDLHIESPDGNISGICDSIISLCKA